MSTMDQRLEFIIDYLSGNYTKKALCLYYGISRPTGDKWIERFRLGRTRGFPRALEKTSWTPPHDSTGGR